jgi:hypothetical protein
MKMIISDLDKTATMRNLLKEGYDLSSPERTNLITLFVNDEDWRHFRHYLNKKDELDYIDLFIYAISRIGMEKAKEIMSKL